MIFGILWKKMENMEGNGFFFAQIKVNKLNDGMLQSVRLLKRRSKVYAEVEMCFRRCANAPAMNCVRDCSGYERWVKSLELRIYSLEFEV